MTEAPIQISLPSTGVEEWLAVKEPLESGWLTQGPQVAAFEREFAEIHRVSHALATTSCTTALHLMLEAAGIGPDDEVIVPSFTWIATANAVLYAGAEPVLCDVDPLTYNISIEDAVARVTDRTRAVLVVHLFGLCADVPTLRARLPEHVMILEDCACAAGANLNGTMAGSLGVAGAFSFHPRKSITTGEGGMLTTNDVAFAEKAGRLRNHGGSISEEQRHHGAQPYLLPAFDELGYNYRMTDLQGAVGRVQLRKLDRFINERDQMAARYIEALADLEWLRMPQRPADGRHAWQSFVTLVDPSSAPAPRNDLMAALHNRGIATRPGTHAIHLLGYYQKRYGYRPEDFPGALQCAESTMAIPLHNRLLESDLSRVIDALHQLA